LPFIIFLRIKIVNLFPIILSVLLIGQHLILESLLGVGFIVIESLSVADVIVIRIYQLSGPR
jgi:hypothetical protein